MPASAMPSPLSAPFDFSIRDFAFVPSMKTPPAQHDAADHQAHDREDERVAGALVGLGRVGSRTRKPYAAGPPGPPGPPGAPQGPGP